MIHQRTYVAQNRAELIRFSQSLFDAVPADFFQRQGQSFDLLMTGDTQSAKSLVPLAGLYSLSDHHDIDDLLAQRVKHGEVEAESPYSIDRFLVQGTHKTIRMAGRDVRVGFDHAVCLDFSKQEVQGEKELRALQSAVPEGGLNILTFGAVPWRATRRHEKFPAVPLAIDVRKTNADIRRMATRGTMDLSLRLSTIFDQYCRPRSRLSGEWAKAAQRDAGHDIPLPRSIVIEINDATPLGAALLQSERFTKFWNQCRRPPKPTPKQTRGKTL